MFSLTIGVLNLHFSSVFPIIHHPVSKVNGENIFFSAEN